MYLSPYLAKYVQTKALELYLNYIFAALENNETVTSYHENQRIALIAKLTQEAVVACDDEPLDGSVFKARVKARFAKPEIFAKAYKEFEIVQAKQAGLLEPSKIVDDLLDGADLNYMQKSTLESYAVIALKKARELGYSLSEMLDYVRSAVTGTSAYTAMVGL